MIATNLPDAVRGLGGQVFAIVGLLGESKAEAHGGQPSEPGRSPRHIAWCVGLKLSLPLDVKYGQCTLDPNPWPDR
jgi:hypothetical protein